MRGLRKGAGAGTQQGDEGPHPAELPEPKVDRAGGTNSSNEQGSRTRPEADRHAGLQRRSARLRISASPVETRSFGGSGPGKCGGETNSALGGPLPTMATKEHWVPEMRAGFEGSAPS